MIEDLIGNTPLYNLDKSKFNGKASVFAKLEMYNYTGSVKDRTALYMIVDAEQRGVLHKGGVIVEATSGNTGISLSAIGRARGYRVVIVMPESMTRERQDLMQAYGAEVVLSRAEEGMSGALRLVEEILSKENNAVSMRQFDNRANSRAHYETTGREIYEQTQGNIDVFVAGIGTGGTLCGVAKRLKEYRSSIEIIGVEPYESPLITAGVVGVHKISGIGADFIPSIYDDSVVDRVMTVSESQAYKGVKRLMTDEGLFVGISSGAVYMVATTLARKPQYAKKRIVTLFPDGGSKYLSTRVFCKETQ